MSAGSGTTAGGTGKWVVAGIVSAGIFIALLDTTIVDIVLPHMMASLDTDIYGVQWVVIIYFLGSAIAMTAVGWVAEVVGHRNIYALGIALFIGMSMLAGAAPSLPMMMFARFFQGIAEGILIPVALVILYETFPPEEHGAAMGVFGLSASFAPALGPTLGGVITEHLTWRWVFYINVPIGIVTLFLILTLFRNVRAREERKPFDFVGFALLATAFSALIVFTGKGEEKGWLDSDFIFYMLLLLVVSGIAAVLWLIFARRPLFPHRILGHRPFRLGLLTMVLLSMNAYGLYLLLPVFLQRIHGYTTLQAGLILLPGAALSAVTTLATGVLSDRVNPKWVAVVALLGTAVATWIFHTDMDTPRWRLVADNIAFGIFIGSTFAPVTVITLGTLELRDIADGSTLLNVVRLIAGSVGTAYSTALMSARTDAFYDALAANVTWHSPTSAELLPRLGAMGAGAGRLFDPDAWARFLAVGHGLMLRRAASYAYHATYEHLALFAVIAAAIVLLVRARPGKIRGPMH